MIEDWVLKDYMKNIYDMSSLEKNSVLNKMVEDIGEFNKINFENIASTLKKKTIYKLWK